MPEDNIPTPEQFLSSQKKVKIADSEIPTPEQFLSSGRVFDPKEAVVNDNIEPVIAELERTSKYGFEGDDKDILKQLLTNPNTTPEQAKKGISTLQGYNEKQGDRKFYYLKQEENGVLVPQPLSPGERPPEGYDVARVFSNAKDAKDDSWYTDVTKSVYNGALVAAEGLLSLAQQGTMAITGEQSEYLNKIRNTVDALKITKDEDLNKRFIKEGTIKEAKDLLNVENYDISPETIWGTMNMLAESVVATIGGGGLVKAAPKVKALFGSYISQLSDNLDGAKEVGLSDREAAGLSAVQTGAMAALDAIGLDQYLFGSPTKAAKKELFKRLAVELPKNADGTLTKEAIQELSKKLPLEYLKIGMKEYGKGVAIEGVTEGGQEFVKRASEALWDKLTPETKAKFGTKIDSPEAFADYTESILAGVIGGLGMGGLSTNYKQKYEEQSSSIMNVIKKGPDAVNELKANLGVAKSNGELTEDEYNQAIFKVDAYGKYNEQTTDVDLTDEEKKEAFELSFNIEALKSEIPTKKEDIEGLDPIGQAKIAAKKELMNGLQKQLNDIILKKDVEKETKVAEDTKAKTEPKEKESEEKIVDELLKKYGKTEKGATVVDEKDINKAIKKPRAKRSETDNVKWAGLTAQEQKQILQEEAKEAPNNEIGVTLIEGQNKTIIGVLDDGKRVDFMQSVDNPNAKVPNYFNYKGLPPKSSEKYVDEAGQELDKYEGTVPIKRVEIDAFEIDENGKEIPSFDSEGNRKRKAVLVAYNPKTGDRLGFVRENSPVNGIYYANKNYTPTEKLELNKLNDINYLSDEITPYLYRPPVERPSGKAKEPKKSDAQELGKGRQDSDSEKREQKRVQRELKQKEEKDAELTKLATTGKDVNPEGMSEKEYLYTVLNESTNPAEIAGAWLNEYESDSQVKKYYDEGKGTIQDMIYAFFKNGGKLSKKSFELHGDRNNMDMSGRRTYFTENGGRDADVAVAINDVSGEIKYVDAQDVIDFINEHPTGIGSYETKFSNNASKLHGKFINLTGKRLNPKYARDLFGKYAEIKDREANTMPPMTAKEASEEMAKEAARDEVFAETGQFQKKDKESKADKAVIDKVIDRMKKAFPKFKIVYNKDLDAAGKIDGNKIEINPFYADIDTPIHEVGHALIDFIGYNNRVIQAGIKQLRGTQFYKDVAAARPELTGELLDKEVLAEAIGKEGAGIFETEAQKSRFKQVLDYIFTKLKQLLGLDKNIAKSLAKQIIGGIGTKRITPVQTEGKSVTLQMPSGEKVDGKEVQVDVVNGFYSNLEKQMLQIKLDKLPAKQWKDKLTGEEAKWTGLTDWLTSKGQQSVTRQEIKDFLKNNRISIIEVSKGGGRSESDIMADIEKKGYELEGSLGEDGYVIMKDDEMVEYDDLPKDVKELYDELASVTTIEGSDTKFSQYQLEGEKENYKEVLVTLPSQQTKEQRQKRIDSIDKRREDLQNKIDTLYKQRKDETKEYKDLVNENEQLLQERQKILYNREDNTFRSSHFVEPNILVHLRMNTRTDAQGNKVLFLEEVQSDWGQKGKKEGFKQGDLRADEITVISGKRLEDRNTIAWTLENKRTGLKDIQVSPTKEGAINLAIEDYKVNSRGSKTPSAPFVTDTNAWVKLGLKVALKEAVAQGVDKIAWTTGEQQNERYDLSKSVNAIHIEERDGKYLLDVWDKSNNKYIDRRLVKDKNELSELVGKDMVDKFSTQRELGYKSDNFISEDQNGNAKMSFQGLDLKVGGKGMKGFYGSPTDGGLGIVGNVAKKLFNQEPKTVEIETGVDTNDKEIIWEELGDGEQRVSIGGEDKFFSTEEAAKKYIDKLKSNKTTQHSIDITPELIAQVGGGLPMFQKKAKKEPLSPGAQKIKDIYEGIKDIEDISAVPYEDLLDAYNYAITNEEFRNTAAGRKAQKEFVKRIGANFYKRNLEKAQNDPKFNPEAAAKTDIGKKDILFKVLSHFTNEFPELKGLSEAYEAAVFKKITETTEKQNTNRKLAIEVIKDRNKSLGIAGRLKENILNLIFGNRNFKYFDYLEGKDGKFITVDEAKKKKLSEAQINYLKFVRNTVAARAGVIDNLKDNWNTEMEVLKTDKKFYESISTENSVAAMSHLLGNTWNIANTRISFTNPNTGKEQIAEYGQIEKILNKHGSGNPIKKAKALAAIIKYNLRARKQLAKGINVDEGVNPLNLVKKGDYSLTKEGKLISKFDRKRSPTRSYSKDFYSAINDYIADTEHIQHMQPIIPIIHGIDSLNTLGLYEKDEDGNILKTVHGKKPNLVEWLNEWSNMHVYKKQKETIPQVDVALRFFRNVASMSMMMFNTTAQLRNAAMGIVNTFIKESGASIKTGMSRLFGSTHRKINSDYAYGLVNPYALELIKKFKAVSTDIDSNPIRSAGGFLTSIGFAGTKWGEFLVQGSQWLGTMSKEDYDSFTWKKNKFGVDELVFKESIPKEKQKEIEARLLDLVNKVSDVQGKYSEKDRRNIQNSEWGKSIMQYRVWLPDWWRVRFSKDAGHWRNLMGGEIWEIRKNLAKAAVDKGYAKAIWQDKNTMSALKELMLIGGMIALLYQDDDDEEKSFASEQGMKILSEMVGVVDPDNAKQIIERPIASMGVVTKFLDAVDHLIMIEADDFYKKDSKYGKEGTPKIVGDIRSVMPGKKLVDTAEELMEED